MDSCQTTREEDSREFWEPLEKAAAEMAYRKGISKRQAMKRVRHKGASRKSAARAKVKR